MVRNRAHKHGVGVKIIYFLWHIPLLNMQEFSNTPGKVFKY